MGERDSEREWERENWEKVCDRYADTETEKTLRGYPGWSLHVGESRVGLKVKGWA